MASDSEIMPEGTIEEHARLAMQEGLNVPNGMAFSRAISAKREADAAERLAKALEAIGRSFATASRRGSRNDPLNIAGTVNQR